MLSVDFVARPQYKFLYDINQSFPRTLESLATNDLKWEICANDSAYFRLTKLEIIAGKTIVSLGMTI